MGSLQSLSSLQIIANCAAIAMTLIAGALWIASLHTDRLALRLFSLRYAIAALGWVFVHPQAQAEGTTLPFASMAFAVLMLLLTAVALDVYLGQATRPRLLAELAASALAALGLWLHNRWRPTDATAIYLVMGLAMGWLAIVAWNAAERERNAGHRIIAVAMLSYPALLVLAVWVAPWHFQNIELAYIAAVPAAVVGVSVLLASLIRFGHRLAIELQQREAAEREVRELNARLEERVAERTAELRHVVEGLEGFVRNIAHDLRGPLAGVAGVARLAEEALARGDSVRALRMLAPVAPQADRLAVLVQDLLALSRIGDGPCARAEQPMDEVIDSALGQLALMPESAPLLERVTVRREPQPRVKIDRGLMEQAFVNLLGNALRFAAAAPSAAPQVSVRTERRNGDLVHVVEDNGPGIPAGREGELFKPFARLHGSALSRNGIGLSIVQRIVEHHGGRVWAEAAPGGGARFCVVLGT